MFGLFDKSAKLVKAIQNRDTNSIEKLLKKGAKVNVSSEPLQKAIETGNPTIVKLILDFSVDLAEEDNTGRTAIERALLEATHSNDEIRHLLQQKADALGLSWRVNESGVFVHVINE